jgi:predicted metal-dependent RNase
MKAKFKEIFEDNGIYIDPFNMDATMKEIEFFIEQIVIECAAVCEEHPSYGGRMLADLILKKFEVDL